MFHISTVSGPDQGHVLLLNKFYFFLQEFMKIALQEQHKKIIHIVTLSEKQTKNG